MNCKRQRVMALALTMGGAAFVSTGSVSAATDNPFGMTELNSGYMQLAGANTGKGAPKKSISVLEGKCGSGKCGASRVRQMMDENGDGSIQRAEYAGWAARQAGAEFDRMARGRDAISPDEAYENFLNYERNASNG